ncbi:hypothetical protein [Geobacter sp.]|uniref:hypothetical protein n=1 Tax=Geobacter sp. TaxID=46610 RepID=UPI002630C322|nr:hypothetical protein [Geobacter sp.]
MRHYAVKPTEEELPRIVTVGMGTLGRMVVRQVRRTLRNAECILLERREEIVHDFPTLGQKVRGADCVLIVLDPRDGAAMNTANWLARRMIAERALVVVLTSESSGDYQHLEGLACSCIVVSPLSISSLSEEVLPRFGKEMLATYLTRHVIEMILRLLSPDNLIGIDFADIKAVMGGGGIMRLGIGVSTTSDAGDAVRKVVESLARQGVDISRCRARLGCVSGSTNLRVDDFNTVCRLVHECLDKQASGIVGILTDDSLVRTVKMTLIAAC